MLITAGEGGEKRYMGDFIKELNVIDFLGILFPGSGFLFLMVYFQTGKIMGLELTATDVVLIISGGYLIGSLIHEAGDLFEKWVWKCLYFDPKVYAAWAVRNYTSAKGKTLDSLAEERNLKIEENSEGDNETSEAGNETIQPCAFQVAVLIWIAFFLTVLPIIQLKSSFVENWNEYIWYVIFLTIISVKASEIEWKLASRFKKELDSLFWIQSANQVIQTELVNKGNYSKRVVFDGFHVMMRNFLSTIVVLNICQDVSNSDYSLLTLVNQCVKSEIGSVVLIEVIIALMIIRYFHYSYLKYKYSYEDFIEIAE